MEKALSRVLKVLIKKTQVSKKKKNNRKLAILTKLGLKIFKAVIERTKKPDATAPSTAGVGGGRIFRGAPKVTDKDKDGKGKGKEEPPKVGSFFKFRFELFYPI